jgi:molecular chaperone GrpE (heat shock protein)
MENNLNTEKNIEIITLINELKSSLEVTSDTILNAINSKPSNAQPEEINSKIPIDEILTQQSSVLASIESSIKILDEKFSNISYKDDINNRLHDELQKYKNGLRKEFVTPLLKGLIREYDRSVRMYKHYSIDEEVQNEEKYRNLLKQFEMTSFGLLELLNDYDIEPFFVNKGDVFNPKEHRVIEVIETSEIDLDNKIEKQLACGFKDISNDRLIRNAEINLYKLKM